MVEASAVTSIKASLIRSNESDSASDDVQRTPNHEEDRDVEQQRPSNDDTAHTDTNDSGTKVTTVSSVSTAWIYALAVASFGIGAAWSL